jgi:hypothetical protein
MLCSSERARHFGGTNHYHLQGQRVCQAGTQQAEVCFLLEPFDPEDGGDMFFWNIGLCLITMLLQPRNHTLQERKDLFSHLFSPQMLSHALYGKSSLIGSLPAPLTIFLHPHFPAQLILVDWMVEAHSAEMQVLGHTAPCSLHGLILDAVEV